MPDNANAMILISFAADSLALGPHWIYDTSQIDQKFGRVENLKKPLENSFHTTKDKGEFTHYGDQTLLLLKLIADERSFDINTFADVWRDFSNSYTGYKDHATKLTLANMADGKDAGTCGSGSQDLGGASRMPPLVYGYRNHREKLIEAVKKQTALTHNTPEVIGSAVFFASVAMEVLSGTEPVRAIQKLADKEFSDDPIRSWIDRGLDSRSEDTRKAILKFGQMCEVKNAFPSVSHLIAKYENNPREALIENVMSGGDSAARGLLAGMVMGAYAGLEAIPQEWIAEMKAIGRIRQYLEAVNEMS